MGEGARTQTTFLSPSRKDGFKSDSRPPPDVQRPNPLGTVYFVPAHAHEIDFHVINIDRHLPQHLCRIRVKKHLVFPAHVPDLRQRLQCPDLVIHRHDRNQTRLSGPNGVLQFLQIDHPRRPHHGKVRHLETLAFQRPTAVEDAFMFRLGGDHVPFFLAVETGDPLDRNVVGLGRAAREDDFFRRSADEVGDLGPGVFDRTFGFPSVGVGPTVGVSESTHHMRKHGVQHSRIHRCSCAHVQVRCSSIQLYSLDAEFFGDGTFSQKRFRKLGIRLISLVSFEFFEGSEGGGPVFVGGGDGGRKQT
mmetsp:Transcript_39614/g.92676  ORF Transcript_39614/g.92676 Transcript_39614/m.92676 type:complete len:304 (-) Transcript_39614:133-1044(-)